MKNIQIIIATLIVPSSGFILPTAPTRILHCPSTTRLEKQHLGHVQRSQSLVRATASSTNEEKEYLVNQLLEYLEKRRELNADDAAQEQVGTTIGGTKGNPVLDWVSVTPVKEQTRDRAPDPFDYDELTKYGYKHLISPIMNAGGRLVMYEWLGLPIPASSLTTTPTSDAPSIEFTPPGAENVNVPNQYRGLKLGQVLDDDLQAEALETASSSTKPADRVTALIQDSSFDQPFSSKKNVSPNAGGEWTAQRLDEWGVQEGKRIAMRKAWAAEAKTAAEKRDPMENLSSLSWDARLFSVATAWVVAWAYGQSTQPFLVDVTGWSSSETAAAALQTTIRQAVAPGMVVAAVGSAIGTVVMAREKNRNLVVWGIKGLLGGPLTVRTMRGLEALHDAESEA